MDIINILHAYIQELENIGGKKELILRDKVEKLIKNIINETKSEKQKGKCQKCGTDNSFHNALHCDDCGDELKD